MCGIAGILKLDPSESVEEERLIAMRDALGHRGPDGAGTFCEGPIGLAHRRLAIVDLAGGHQPMTTASQAAWIVFNGEIYNHAELRADLEPRGHRYRTRSDTETILHLWEEQGERCVESLRGMFAFALWDRRRHALLLARDRLGIKPLYYAITARELVFDSEVKALLASGAVRAALDAAALPELLASRFVAGEETLFAGVRKLLPGRTLLCAPGGAPRQRRWWRPPAEAREPDGRATLEGAAVALRARLESAVRSHLMSDVPLGVFLSGGLDSSGLAALAAPMADGPLRTFAVGFREGEANELAYARLAADAIGAEHREIVVSPEEFFRALPRLVWHEDEPLAFSSSVPLHFVSRLAREHVKVVLTGEGADELFLGYNRYRVTLWNERLGRVFFALASAAARRRLRRALGELPAAARRYASRTFLALAPGPRALFCENFAVFPTEQQRALLADRWLLAARDPWASALAAWEESDGGPLHRMSCVDLQGYLARLLVKQDQMSMAASIESRVPYLDPPLVEHVLALPDRLKLAGWQTKAVLRAALRSLVPAPILERGKMGFPVPIGRWLRGRFWPVVAELVLSPRALGRGLFRPAAVRELAERHRAGVEEHGDRLWMLANLEIWHRVFIDGEAPEDVAKRL